MIVSRRHVAFLESEIARLQQRERDLLNAILISNKLPHLTDEKAAVEPETVAVPVKLSRVAQAMAWRGEK
jgi:hypothetical protein